MSRWPRLRLGELCEVLDSKRKPITKSDRVHGDVPYFGASGVLDFVKDYIFDEKLVLLGEDGAKWGAGDRSAFIIEGKSWINNHVHVLRPDRNLVLDEWLASYLVSADLSDFITGVTVPKLNQARMRDISIPLPPLDEQKRIVAKLDQLRGAIDLLRDSRASKIRETNALQSALLNKIVSATDSSDTSMSLGELTAKIGSGATPRGGKNSYTDSGTSFIRSLNVHDSDFRRRGLAFLSDDQAASLANVEVVSGDLLLNITGASIARTCIVPDDVLPARVNQHVAILRAKPNVVSPQYLALLLVSQESKRRLLSIGEGAGTTRQALTKAQLSQFSVRFPKDLEVQKRRVAKAKEVLSTIDRYRTLLQESIEALGALETRALAAGFSGEL